MPLIEVKCSAQIDSTKISDEMTMRFAPVNLKKVRKDSVARPAPVTTAASVT